MKKNYLLACILVAITVITLVVGGCSSTSTSTTPASSTAASGTPIKIGALLSMTGIGASLGPPNQVGIKMRLDEANNQVAGHPIQLVVQDDATDPQTALEKAKNMAEVDKVNVMLGPIFGPAAMSTQPYLAKIPIPSLSLQQQGAAAGQWGWFFLTSGTGIDTGRALGWYTYDNMGGKTAVTLAEDDDPGHQFVDGWSTGFLQKGGQIIQQVWPPPGTTDFTSYLLSLKQADMVVVWSGSERFLLKQANDMGLLDKTPWVLIQQGDLSYDVLQQVGEAATKVKAMLVNYSSLIDTPENAAYVDRAVKGGYGLPDPFGYSGYEATSVVLAALQATNGDTNPNKLKQAILGLKLQTPKGLLTYTSELIGVSDLYVFKVIKTDTGYNWSPIFKYPNYTCYLKDG